MFATYSLNIRRLLTQSIRHRPNLNVKNEHGRIIAEYSLAFRENCSRQRIFFPKGYLNSLTFLFAVEKLLPVCVFSWAKAMSSLPLNTFT